MFSLIYAWINGWVNNREAGDLRRHRTHYDITVMASGWLCHRWMTHSIEAETKRPPLRTDDIFKCISWNKNYSVLNKISLKYVPCDLVDAMATLIQILVWPRTVDRIIWSNNGMLYWHIYMSLGLKQFMMTSSNGNIFRWPVNSPHKWPVTRSFDVFFDLRLNKHLSKQSWGWWFETLSRPLWRHCNVTLKAIKQYLL